MTCVAQEAPASKILNKTYSPYSQHVIEWDENMITPIDSVHVSVILQEVKQLPDMERRLKTKEVTDLMRKSRNPE